MPSLFIIDETDAHSSPASSSRRARTEWNLRKRFDYAGHRREMVQSFREADKFFKEHLQFQKQKRRESVVSARRISTAEEKQAEDEVLADVHQNAGSLVTPAGGGFGPGFNMTGLKKTLDEKREARERLIHRVHHLEGYAATPGIATISDPETGRVKIVAQSKKEEEEMKQKGNTKPFVDKARLFPPLRTKTIPTNSSPLSASSTPRMTTTVSTNPAKGEENNTMKSLIHNHDEEDLGKLLNLATNTDSTGGEKSPNSGLLSVSQLSKKIMANQTVKTTPTPLLMSTTQNPNQQNTDDEVFRLPTLPSASRRGTTTTTTVNNNSISSPQQQQQQQQQQPPSFNTMATATCQLPPSLSSPRSGLDTLFGNAKQNLKNAPIATASRTHATNTTSVANNSINQYLTSAQGSFIVGASGQVVTSGRSRGSSRTVSRGQSRRTSFIFSPNSNSPQTGLNSNNNTTTAIDLGNLTEDEFASLGLNSSIMSSPKFASTVGGGGGNNSYTNFPSSMIPPHYHQQQQQQQQRQRGASHHRSAGAGPSPLSGSGNINNNNNQKEGSLNTLDLGTTGTMRNTTQQQQRRHTQHNHGVLKIVIASNNTSV